MPSINQDFSIGDCVYIYMDHERYNGRVIGLWLDEVRVEISDGVDFLLPWYKVHRSEKIYKNGDLVDYFHFRWYNDGVVVGYSYNQITGRRITKVKNSEGTIFEQEDHVIRPRSNSQED